MAITKTVQAPISKGLVNSLSDSISLQAGDLLLYAIHNRDNHQFAAPTWNGQTLIEAAALSPFSYFKVFYVLAAATATANLTSTAAGFTDTNVAWVRFRSSTNSFTSTPFRDVKTISYTSGTYANPSVTLAGLVAGDNVASFLAWSGWNTAFGNVQSTTAVESNLTAEGVVQNSSNQNTPGRTYLSSGTGYTGNTAVGYTKSGAGSPVHGMIAIAVQESSQLISTFTDPVVPGSPASGTQTGFANGAITADFGGLTFTGTVSGSALSGSVSSFVDGGLCPLLPAASVSGTFTQGGNTASLTRAVSVPAGLRELRDGGGSPANFAGLVLGDPKYLGQSFADAGNPLTTLDRSYVDPSYGLTIDQDGRIRLNATDHPTDPVPSLPHTTTIWVRRGADGRVYSHSIVISESGAVVVTPSIAPRSRSLLRVSSSTLTIDGTAHTNGQPVSLSPYGGIQSGINGQWLAQSVSASAGSLVVDGVTITPPKALYLSPAGKLTATPNGRPVATVRA